MGPRHFRRVGSLQGPPKDQRSFKSIWPNGDHSQLRFYPLPSPRVFVGGSREQRSQNPLNPNTPHKLDIYSILDIAPCLEAACLLWQVCLHQGCQTWPAGQIQPMEPCHPTRRAPRGTDTRVRGLVEDARQWQGANNGCDDSNVSQHCSAHHWRCFWG